MAIASLREHLVEELTDLLGAEEQLQSGLKKMADRASDRMLRTAFQDHLSQTEGHARRLEQSLELLGSPAKGKTCKAMKGLLDEGQELMDSGDPGALLDAMLITAAQKVEHYEIASYGTARTYADLLGERGVVRLLGQTLKEEKSADKKLTRIAEQSVNRRASKEWHEHASAAGLLEKSAQWIGTTVGSAVGKLKAATAADKTAATKSEKRRLGKSPSSKRRTKKK